jgi:uncharacterized protein (DUF1778 family)
MTTEHTRISASVSAETNARLENFARHHGLDKSDVIETALLHHLQALSELPPEVIVPPRLIVTEASGRRLLERLDRSAEPTAAMHELFRDD